jgi:lactobin A/cerein 7B family class IIb bacteriocin
MGQSATDAQTQEKRHMQQTVNFANASDLRFVPEAEEISIEQLDDVNGGIFPVIAAAYAIGLATGVAIGYLAAKA